MKEKSKDQKSELALIKKDVVDVATERINQLVGSGHLQLPKDYSEVNALLSWWLALQTCKDKDGKLALQVCTKDSIANATLDMVVQGLSPSKKQCYPIVYGNKLVCQRSYFGDEALLRRARQQVEHVRSEVYYAGDKLEWEFKNGCRTISKHLQAEENIGGLDKIHGCYVVIADKEENVIHCERMTIDQIKKSWKKSKTYDGKRETFHLDQPEEAAKRTVIRRACKRLINASDDSYLVKAVERQAYLAEESKMQERVKEEGNKDAIDIESGDKGPAAETAAEKEARIKSEKKDQPAEPKEESPSSPSARFVDFMDEHKLDPTKARRTAAAMRKLKDVRNLGNEDFEAVLNNSKAFLASYRQQYAGGQPKLDGPGF